MDMSELCRRYSSLSAMQINFLYRISVVMPIVADLAHAHTALYVRAKDESQGKKLLVAATARPHTTLDPFGECKAGSLRPCLEEAVICRTLADGRRYHGRREVEYGRFIEMYTIPVKDENDSKKTIAAICFEANPGDVRRKGFTRLLKAALTILQNCQKKLDAKMYRCVSPRDGIIIADKDERIIFASETASRIYHVLGVSNLIGCHIFDRQLTMHTKKETILHKCAYEKEIEMGNLVIIRRDIPVMEAGRLLTRVIVLSDVTEVRKKDKELLIKSAVIQEIHHRVKNNLQMIASLLRLQARRSKSQEVRDALHESINRILSISVVHEFLSQQGDEKIDVVEVTKNILGLIEKNMLDENFKLTTKFSGDTIILPSKHASNIALIINELILNAVEHGFAGRDRGLIGLDIEQTADAYIIELYNDGADLPSDFDRAHLKSLGLQIITMLVEGDWGGAFELYSDRGTHARITIPYKSLMEEEDV